jgi:hypothetical protein
MMTEHWGLIKLQFWWCDWAARAGGFCLLSSRVAELRALQNFGGRGRTLSGGKERGRGGKEKGRGEEKIPKRVLITNSKTVFP